MLSALIHSRRGYPAVRLAAQPVNRRSVHHGPLVLVAAPRKTPTPTIDRDRTVSRRSEPSSGGISLLSPEYLLSFERRSFHTRPPDHYAPVSCLLGMSPSQSSALMPLHSRGRLPIGLRAPLEASVTLLEATTPVKLPAKRCPHKTHVRPRTAKGPYFKGGSTKTGVPASKPPAYPTHRMTKVSAKL